MKINVDVTQNHIDKSFQTVCPGQCKSCPIYFAIQEFPELKGYLVGSESLYQYFNNFEIPLPAEASIFAMNAFDRNDELLKPFSFELELTNW